MKKLIIFFFMAVIFTACASKSTKDKIVGEWQLTSVSGEELTDKEKSTVINFKADGNATNSRREGDVKKWEVKTKEDKEYLSLGDEEFELKSIDDKKMVFIQGSDEITLTKK